MWLPRIRRCSIKPAIFFLLIIGIITAGIPCLVYSGQEAGGDTVYISLVYPQESNAPKRQAGKIEDAGVFSGRVSVSVSGIAIAQANNTTLYVEYFLDNRLIYSSQDKKSLSFELDTVGYANGEHVLTANLWDKNGPSAIGIRKITIQNGK